MSTPSAKHRIISVIQDQPEDATFDEILRELAIARMIERGLADSNARRVISHEDVKRQIEAWRK
jgi:predicted transcriptional regulator